MTNPTPLQPITHEQEYDIVIVGGGTAGPMAAIKAKEANPALRILLIDKANVKTQWRDLDGHGWTEQRRSARSCYP